MENQHRQIQGYRDFDEGTVAVINTLKKFGTEAMEQTLAMVADLVDADVRNWDHERNLAEADVLRYAAHAASPEKQEDAKAALTNASRELRKAKEAQRWLAMARTDWQVGLMKLIRAVAKPEGF